MCFIPDIPTLSPLPAAAIPPELPTLEPEPGEGQTFWVVPRRVDENGREYYPHQEYAFSAEVPMDRRNYIDNDDDVEIEPPQVEPYYYLELKPILKNLRLTYLLNPFQMANNGEDRVDSETDEKVLMGEEEAHSTEEEEMEEDEEELVPSEDEEQELPAKVDSPPPPQPNQPPQPSESHSRSVENFLWRRLREAELALKKKDNEIHFLHSKAEYAFRQAQDWEYVAKRVATDYREAFDRSWMSLKHLQMAPAHEQTPQAIDHVTSTLEQEYNFALTAERKRFQ